MGLIIKGPPSQGVFPHQRTDGSHNPYHPWDWYIYLHLVDFYGFHVGKYAIHDTWMLMGKGANMKPAPHDLVTPISGASLGKGKHRRLFF